MALSGSGRRARRHGGGVGAKTVPQMLTPVPFCRSLIDETLLSEEETRWMDRHHNWCHATRCSLKNSLEQRRTRSSELAGMTSRHVAKKWLEEAVQRLNFELALKTYS